MSRRSQIHGPGYRRRKAQGSGVPRVAGLRGSDLKALLDSIEPHTLPPAKGRKLADGMNGTERSYSQVLEARKAAGEVVAWWYECVGLKLAPSTHYYPDFMVLLADGTLEIHEVKGGRIEEDAWAKFKISAKRFPFTFRLCQWRDKRWFIEEF